MIVVLRRYLAREIYAASALVLAVFLSLLAFFDLIHELTDLGKGDYRMPHIVAFVLLSLPGHVYELAPIAVLIGTLFALAQLVAHSEYTVMRISGLSTFRATVALMQIGLVFVVITFVFGEFVSPPAEHAAQQLRVRAMSTVVAQEFRSGLWVKDELSFINVREVLPDSRLKGISIYEFDADYRLRSIRSAARGEYLPPDHWTLADVVETRFDDNGTQVLHLPESTWKSAINPDILSVLLVKPEYMSAWNLYQYTRHLAENKQKTEQYDIAMWKKLVYPFAALVMMALALPFAYMQGRSGSVGLKVFVGVMLGVLFWMLNGLFSSLGVIRSWPPFLAALLPSLLFLLAAAAMMWKVERT
jgi:lipopolysaccharide export system permease protein